MALVLKVLLGMLVTFPVGAYFVGTLVGPYDTVPPDQPSATSPPTDAGSDTPRGGPARPGPTDGASPAATLADWAGADDTWGPTLSPSDSPADGQSGPAPAARLGQQTAPTGEPTPSAPATPSDSASPSPSDTGTPSETPSESPSDTSSPTTDPTGSPAPSDPPTSGSSSVGSQSVGSQSADSQSADSQSVGGTPTTSDDGTSGSAF